MTPNEMRALLSQVGTLPISPSWTYMSIRHCQRNMDFEEYQDDDLNVPDRQGGGAIAKLVNAAPSLISAAETLDELLRAVAGIDEAYHTHASLHGMDKARDVLANLDKLNP